MRKFNRFFGTMLCVLGLCLSLGLVSCGKSGSAPAYQPTTEITAAKTTLSGESPAETTTGTVQTVQSRTTARTTLTELTSATAASSSETADETTSATPFSAESTTEAVTSLTSAAPVPEYVRIVISAEEIMQAAGLSESEMISGVLDIENTSADTGSIMVARERPWNDPDSSRPDWLYRVTEITVDGIVQGQTVTVTGVAVCNERDGGSDEESWYTAKRVPFTITRTAGVGN